MPFGEDPRVRYGPGHPRWVSGRCRSPTTSATGCSPARSPSHPGPRPGRSVQRRRPHRPRRQRRRVARDPDPA